MCMLECWICYSNSDVGIQRSSFLRVFFAMDWANIIIRTISLPQLSLGSNQQEPIFCTSTTALSNFFFSTQLLQPDSYQWRKEYHEWYHFPKTVSEDRCRQSRSYSYYKGEKQTSLRVCFSLTYRACWSSVCVFVKFRLEEKSKISLFDDTVSRINGCKWSGHLALEAYTGKCRKQEACDIWS